MVEKFFDESFILRFDNVLFFGLFEYYFRFEGRYFENNNFCCSSSVLDFLWFVDMIYNKGKYCWGRLSLFKWRNKLKFEDKVFRREFKNIGLGIKILKIDF